jgi:hypothetical protein
LKPKIFLVFHKRKNIFLSKSCDTPESWLLQSNPNNYNSTDSIIKGTQSRNDFGRHSSSTTGKPTTNSKSFSNNIVALQNVPTIGEKPLKSNKQNKPRRNRCLCYSISILILLLLIIFVTMILVGLFVIGAKAVTTTSTTHRFLLTCHY